MTIEFLVLRFEGVVVVDLLVVVAVVATAHVYRLWIMVEPDMATNSLQEIIPVSLF